LRLRAIFLFAVLAAATCAAADAKITSVNVLHRDPFAPGTTYGPAGAYERISGTVHGELDPADPRNAKIVNLANAPRNARGMVEYDTDFEVLRPVDATKSNHALLYEVVNRGRKFLLPWVLDAKSAAGALNDPATADDAGTGTFFNRGYTIVWSGWEPDAPRADNGMTIRLPIATKNGAPIVQRIRDEFVYSTRVPVTQIAAPLSYDAASLDQSQAQLTVRGKQTDAPTIIPASGWAYVDNRHVKLLPEGTKFAPVLIYEFTYPATNPKPLAIGYAATRDLVAYLRHDKNDLVGPIDRALALGISQSGRYLRNYLADGFNQDENKRIVFEGVMTHISGSGGLFDNEQFAQPGRTNTQHEDHDYPEYLGPTASLFHHDAFDPYLFEVNTSTEFWQKGASLDYTDATGTHEKTSEPRARYFLIAGTQHAGRAWLTDARGNCAVARNPHNPGPALRALFIALDDWASRGIAPPDSRVPTLASNTLVTPDALHFPHIPGITAPTATDNVTVVTDWVAGTHGMAFVSKVPAVDADGNETSGIRLPDIAAPIATFTGWNFYGAPYPSGELCDRDGTYVPFALTAADRAASGDPRLSLAERYGTRDAYLAKVKASADALVRDRVLLPEDADRAVTAAQAAWKP
jgi:hypothetical protein